ncbi:MAG: hypothetical protein DRP50_05990 [Thermotoga sp.]|nr:MAG: hypothetical protein DRP50_05990 [Thermotoga sp.]
MKLRIEVCSYTLLGSGEGSGLIDADIVFDEFGIPYIPARRVKGILKEIAQEVCEILGISEKIVGKVFGEGGFLEGKLRFENLYIENYSEIKDELEQLKNTNEWRNLLHRENIVNYFTTLRYQTAIESGVAKEGSLRTFRVLKPHFVFIGKIKRKDLLSPKESAILYLAVRNFKRIGTSRNRGYGEVNASIISDGMDTEKAIEILLKDENEVIETESMVSRDVEQFSYSGKRKMLEFFIRTLAPVVISKQRGEQNTVNTEKYIPSSTIRGVLANAFIEKLRLKSAHEDDRFYTLFLKGDLLTTPAYPVKDGNEYLPAPLFLHKKKGEEEIDGTELYNILEEVPGEKTKPLGGYVYFENGGIRKHIPGTEFFFHNARERISGKATKKEGAIFYYEAIKEEEKFKGYIMGDENLLNAIKGLYEDGFSAYVGRSKTAQYGHVEFEFGGISNLPKISKYDKDFFLLVTSPLILFNEFGFPEASERVFKRYLERLLDCEIEIKASAVKVQYVESFVGIWRMKSSRVIAIAPGSCFNISLIECNDPEDKLNRLENYGMGERAEQGFGRVRVLIDIKERYSLRKEKTAKRDIKPLKILDILVYVLKTKEEEYFEYKGFERARTFGYKGQITNHLLGRLERMLADVQDKENWQNFLNEIKDRQAGKKLKDVRLWDELYNFDICDKERQQKDFQDLGDKLRLVSINVESEKKTFDLSKIYWLSFLRNLRIIKKMEG